MDVWSGGCPPHQVESHPIKEEATLLEICFSMFAVSTATRTAASYAALCPVWDLGLAGDGGLRSPRSFGKAWRSALYRHRGPASQALVSTYQHPQNSMVAARRTPGSPPDTSSGATNEYIIGVRVERRLVEPLRPAADAMIFSAAPIDQRHDVIKRALSRG